MQSLLRSFFYCFIIITSTHYAALYTNCIADAEVAQAYVDLAQSFLKNKKYLQAIITYEHALTLTPHNALLHWECGNVYKEINAVEQAIELYKIALALDPAHINIRFSLANALVIADHPEQAFEHYRSILEQHPSLHCVLYNYGFALKKAGYILDAITTYKQVLSIDPNYEHAHFSMGLSYLMLGDFEHGWPEYEWREKPKKRAILNDHKAWTGEQSLTDKTILLMAEQGLGDTFQFIRYAQLLKTQGAPTIICQVQPPLMSILSRCPYIDRLISQTTSIDDLVFDYHIQLLSLPYRCNTTLDTIPGTLPYLYADPDLVAEWGNRLSHDQTFKIGICWHGNAQYATQSLQRAVAAKSITPAHFEPVASIQGITLYNLQKINGLEDLSTLGFCIQDFGPDLDTTNGRFMDTAAIMKNMDLIITVDTSIAHLAGGLGVPVWVLLPYPADWRWMMNRSDTPWYPTMRLFRQTSPGDWATVFEQVTQALYQLKGNV